MKPLYIISILVFVLFLTWLVICKPNYSLSEKQAQLIDTDTTEMLLKDRRFLLDLEKKNLATLNTVIAVNDTMINKQALLFLIKANHQKNEKLIDSIHALKNKEIFPFKAAFYQLKEQQLNIWALLVIIISSGVLGGFVRTKYWLLTDLTAITNATANMKTALKNIETAVQTNNKEIENKSSNIQGAIQTEDKEHAKNIQQIVQTNSQAVKKAVQRIEQPMVSFQESIENLKQEIKNNNTEQLIANMSISLIAATVAFFALHLFASKILDFQSDMDYFILSGCCMLAALFSKSWVEFLYDKFKQTTNTN